MHKIGPYLLFFCYMRNWTMARLLCYLMTKPLCCPLIPPARAIRFRERSPTCCTTKSSFVDNQSDLIESQPDISFRSFAYIMYLSAYSSTSRADITLCWLLGTSVHKINR